MDTLTVLSDLSIVQVSGERAEKFLQGQLTCDVTEVNPQQSRLGAHCDHKGRIQATFRLFFYRNNYYCLLPSALTEHFFQCLNKYAALSRAELKDASHCWKKSGLYGPHVEAWLAAFYQEIPAVLNQVSIQADETILLKVPGLEPRFIVLNPADGATELSLHLANQPIEFTDEIHWQWLDILAGIPTIYPETVGKFTPHQIDYPAIHGVSFNKGCYTGQEIVARMHYLGKPKQKMYSVTFRDRQLSKPGTELCINHKGEAKSVGLLIMSALSEAGEYHALVCLEIAAVSSSIHVRDLSGPVVKILNPSH